MKTYEFKVAEHEDYGLIGLCPTWMGENPDPLDGTVAAHDILEHGPKDDGSIEAEFMAFGAMFYVRGYDYFASKGRYNPDPAYQAHSDVWEQYRYAMMRGESFTLRDPGRVPPCDEDDTIERMLDLAKSMCRAEAEHDEQDPEAMDEWLSEENIRRMRGWMRKGYRRAVRRYRNCSWPGGLFYDIEKALQPYCVEEYLGQTIKVRVDINKRIVRVDDPWDQEDDDYSHISASVHEAKKPFVYKPKAGLWQDG